MPEIYIIGGPNGAGKTTAALTVLPEIDCLHYVNADLIAGALSPFAPEQVAVKAGRLLLERINELAAANESFSFESTLASKSFVQFLKHCKADGYVINLLYFWLNSPELAKQRVAIRVSQGGHNIPTEVIERRYYRSVKNLFELYLPLADYWTVFDNSADTYFPERMIEGFQGDYTVYNPNRLTQLLEVRNNGQAS